MKTCHHCLKEKAESAFYPHRDGLRPECKACTRTSKNPRMKAYSRALRELKTLHPDEFEKLYTQQYQRLIDE